MNAIKILFKQIFLFNTGNFICPISQHINFLPFRRHTTFITFCGTKMVEHTKLIFLRRTWKRLFNEEFRETSLHLSKAKVSLLALLFLFQSIWWTKQVQISFVFSISMPKHLYSIDSV